MSVTSSESEAAGSFYHETYIADLEIRNLSEAIASRFQWAWLYSRRVARAIEMPSTETRVKELNYRLILPEELEQRAGQKPGIYRTGNVGVRAANFKFVDHKFVPGLMATFGSKMDGLIINLDRKMNDSTLLVSEVIEAAAFDMYWFMRIHPFADGNGRTGREDAQILCQRYGLPPIFVGQINRREYTEALLQVNTSVGDPFKFQADLTPLTRFIAGCIINQAPEMGTKAEIVDACNTLFRE